MAIPLTPEELEDELVARDAVVIGGKPYHPDDIFRCAECDEPQPFREAFDENCLCSHCAEAAAEYEDYCRQVATDYRSSVL
ncbi:hypothetical protein D3C71_1524710 [compost metagenome]